MYEIVTEKVLNDFSKTKEIFEFNNYSFNNSSKNGMFETHYCWEFVGLNPKTYSVLKSCCSKY